MARCTPVATLLVLAASACDGAPPHAPHPAPPPATIAPPEAPPAAEESPEADADAAAPAADAATDAGGDHAHGRIAAADLIAGCTATTTPQPSKGKLVEVRVDVRTATDAERRQSGSDTTSVVAVVTAKSLGAHWVVFADSEPAGCSAFVRGDDCLSFTCRGDLQVHPVLIRSDGGSILSRDQSVDAAPGGLAGPGSAATLPRALGPEQAHMTPLLPGVAVRFKVVVAPALKAYSSAVPAGL